MNAHWNFQFSTFLKQWLHSFVIRMHAICRNRIRKQFTQAFIAQLAHPSGSYFNAALQFFHR